MARVRCDLPNASENISGVAFMPAVDGSHVLSEEIADEIAARFCSIPGYSLVEESTSNEGEADAPALDEPPVVPEVVPPVVPEVVPPVVPEVVPPVVPEVVPDAAKPTGKRAPKAAATTEEVEK